MSPDTLQALAAQHPTLAEVTRASVAHGWTLLEVITQDEYTHDIVYAAPPFFLVYDCT